jgi:hypothetical protein
VKYLFEGKQNEHKFNLFYENFKLKNTFDVLQNFTFGYKVPGMIERKAFYVGKLDCDLVDGTAFAEFAACCGPIACG